MEKSIKGFKGFDKDFKCNGFQYKPESEFKHDGPVKACSSGFHFCEHPLDVFSYYPPAGNRFAEVEGAGTLDKHSDDTKVACSTLKIGAEISLSAYIQGAVKFVFDRAKWTTEKSATGDQGAASATGTRGAASATGDQGAASATGTRGAASATGYQGAASATGCQGAASATGDQGAASATGTRGAASATGDQGAASATGDQGAASATGYQGAASATGEESCAIALGIESKVKGIKGAFLTCAEWKCSDKWHRVAVKSVRVDGKKIKAETWYTLKDGKFTEVK